MTDYTSEIDAWYQAIQYRNPPASELASFNAQLQAGIITTAQAVTQIEASTYTQSYVDPVIREYQAAFGRVPDQAGVAYWVGQVATNPANLALLSTAFANSAEFFADYAASATTPASSTLVTALYQNVLGRAPDAAGLAYWSNSGLDAAQLLQSFAQSPEFITDTTPYVIQFQNAEVAGDAPTSGSIYNQAIPGGIAANTYTITYGAPTTFSFTGTAGGVPVTGTIAGGPIGPISSTEAAGNSNVTINASLGLNNSQSIVFNGINNVLNADYTAGVGLSSLTSSTFPNSNFDQVGLNIQGVQTWNIQAEVPINSSSSSFTNTIIFTGDASQGNVISGLTTVNFNDNSGDTSLIIGDNSEPVQEPNGANGFTINVSNAVGYETNGVDVDIAAQAFTGTDTIHVGAHIVGGFPESNGSYIVPALQFGANNGDLDTYNPNWDGWQDDAFAISAGASASSLTTLNGVTLPPTGAVGFQNWVISSTGAKEVGSVNILALGNEGSWNAQTITMTDDGSTTFLFATAFSDSLSTDWQNIKTVDLSGTSGQVIITGAETDANIALAEDVNFVQDGGGGLLTSDTSALVTIKGGAGNSFYDLSSLTLAAAGAASIQGGTSTKGNSEVAFNNSVVASVSTTNPNGVNVNISNIQVLDDTGNPVTAAQILANAASVWNGQGGTMNMANFAGLAPLNANYDLLSGPLGNLIGGPVFQSATFAAGTDVAPKGYELLQLLDADGSTENYLGSNLNILNGFTQFAINAQDVWDGTAGAASLWIDGVTSTHHYAAKYSIQPDYAAIPGALPPGGTIYPAGDNAYVVNTSAYDLYSYPLTTLTGYDITIVQESPVPTVNVQSHLKLWVADDGVNIYKGSVAPGNIVGTIFNSSQVVIDNYTTADIYLPYESVKGTQNWVVLGSEDPTIANGHVGGFNDTPVVSVPLLNGTAANVNFYDNTVDTGGSPPGGADNLVLGFTNFTADLAPVSTVAFYDPQGTIGYTTVAIDATTTTTITDFGHGTFEIGATNATNLYAQSTAGLIMDVSAVPQWIGTNGIAAATGIIVDGSLTGQNLLQGSSGQIQFDYLGHLGPANSGLFGNTGTSGVLEGLAPFQDYGVGNDSLTGGVGSGILNGQGLNAYNDAQTWVTGDNYFPEGGIDTVNLSHAATNTAYDAVWVGMYDVSSFITAKGDAPHYVFGQAVTDISGGVETYVDGYGPSVTATGLSPEGNAVAASGSNTSLLTVHGFVEGSNTNSGDIVNFNPQDWANSLLALSLVRDPISGTAVFNSGLVDTSGASELGNTTTTAYQAKVVYVGTSASAGGHITGTYDVILDGLAGYQNASQLAQALQNADGGDIGGLFIAGKTTEHLLIAYNNTVTGGVTIDDVTLTNIGLRTATTTSANGVEVSAVDVVDLVGTAANPATIGSLLHNIYFLHG